MSPRDFHVYPQVMGAKKPKHNQLIVNGKQKGRPSLAGNFEGARQPAEMAGTHATILGAVAGHLVRAGLPIRLPVQLARQGGHRCQVRSPDAISCVAPRVGSQHWAKCSA